MTFLLAPDSFKHCMSAQEAAQAMEEGILSQIPSARVIKRPMADGGEGTGEIIAAALNCTRRVLNVRGPLGDSREAEYYLSPDGQTAVMEMASASGIQNLPRDRLNPLLATSYGTGELIATALDAGARKIIMGIGGSATVDGGVGMAQALGFRFLDARGQDIPGLQTGDFHRIAKIDTRDAHPGIRGCRVQIASDVDAPLLGPLGAARVFGPQKGASPEMIPELEAGLSHLLELWTAGRMIQGEAPGDGAAGGLGAGLRAFLKAELLPGAELLAELTGFHKHVEETDWVLTGEGRTDSQTRQGKLCSYVAQEAKKRGKMVGLLAGAIAEPLEESASGFDYAVSISPGPESLEEALRAGRKRLEFAAAQFAKLLCASRFLPWSR